MLDSSPWFRRWMGFSFIPISWKGWATIGVFLLLEASIGFIQASPGSLPWWLLAALGFAIFLAFWAFCVRKTEAT
jgi:hypothetical protein